MLRSAGTSTMPKPPSSRSASTDASRRPKRPTDTASERPELSAFLLHLASERGLADNTLHAYRRDLEDLERYLADKKLNYLTAGADDFRYYLQSQSRQGQSTRTVARRLAAIRVFLRFLATIGHDRAAILQHLERPKPEKALPKVLSRAQVNQLIAAPNPESPFFSRDVAILELLYASGLRATELCQLKLRDLNLGVGCVRVLGKGSKERIVPVGHAAIEALTRYLTEERPKFDSRQSELVFLSRTGRPLERIALWMIIEKHGR